MALTTDDVNAVVAQWEEWTADAGFKLSIEVKTESVAAEMIEAQLGARLESNLYLQVTITRGEHVVFEQRVPYDAQALRASITVLARTIAAHQDDG